MSPGTYLPMFRMSLSAAESDPGTGIVPSRPRIDYVLCHADCKSKPHLTPSAWQGEGYENFNSTMPLRSSNVMTPENQANLVAQLSKEVMKSLEATLESRFGDVLQSVAILAKFLEMNQSHDTNHVLQRNPVIRYLLENDSDHKKIKDLFESDLLRLLQRAGDPFNQIIRVSYSRKELRFTAKSESAELRIRAVASEISRHLNLSPSCRAVPKPYFVCVVNATRKQFGQPRPLKVAWGVENGVEIANAFWTRNHLVLALWDLEHARKLVSEGICLGEKSFSYVR